MCVLQDLALHTLALVCHGGEGSIDCPLLVRLTRPCRKWAELQSPRDGALKKMTNCMQLLRGAKQWSPFRHSVVHNTVLELFVVHYAMDRAR